MTTVLVTGSAGSIGRTVTAGLAELDWDVRGFDRVPHGDSVVGELADAAALDAALAGVDAVVHLAGQATETGWPVIRDANIDGPRQVLEAARRAGVRRVVLASSNHAVGFTPVGEGNLPPDLPPRPDTLYGVSKVFLEALGRYYVDRYGLQVACLRIGTFGERPTSVRSLATWLSRGGAVRFVDSCLRARDLDYAVVWGISANTRRQWSLDAGRALGYEPLDDAEHWAEQVTEAARESDAFVGGAFTEDSYGQDAYSHDVSPADARDAEGTPA